MTHAVRLRTADRSWLIPAGLVVLGLVPSAAGVARLAELARHPAVTEANARFVAAPWPVRLHVVAVVLFALVGAFQFWPAFRRASRRWHARAGRILVAAGFLAALSGLWMTFVYPWPEADGMAVYLMRLTVGGAMIASLALGLLALVRRAYHRHGEWMLRAYALGMGAGTQVFTHLPWFVLVGQPTEGPRAVMMAAGWLINLMVAEWVIATGRLGGGVASGSRSVPAG